MTIGSRTIGLEPAVLRRVGAGLMFGAALAALSGCTAYEEVFGDEPVPGIVTTGTGDQQNAVVPSLASVPGRPQPSSEAQRRALQAALREDRSRAVYSTEPPAPPPAAASDMTASDMTASGMTDEVERPGLPPEAPSALPPSASVSSSASSQSAEVTTAPPPPPPPPASSSSRTSGEAVPAPGDATGTSSAAGPAQIAQRNQGQINQQQLNQSQYNQPCRPAYSEMVGVIFFDYGSAQLDQRDVEVLREIVRLQQERGGQLRVVGHASMRTGVADPLQHNLANFNTSLERAQNVARRLEALGAQPVVVEAMGSAQPVYYEFMPTGEAGNRRAEIFLDF